MTTLIVTAHERFVAVSQDTLVAKATGDVAAYQATVFSGDDMTGAAAATFVGSDRCEPVEVLGFVPKITVCPQFGMVMAGTGMLAPVWRWRDALNGGVPTDSFDAVNERAPDGLRKLQGELDSPQSFVIVHAGWSHREGRALAWLFNSADDFEPVRIDRGHTMNPPADATQAGYDRVAELWEPAAAGVGTTVFHVALARNHFTSYEAGRLRPGVGIGGQLHTATVSPTGIRLEVSHRFPGFHGQLAALAHRASSEAGR